MLIGGLLLGLAGAGGYLYFSKNVAVSPEVAGPEVSPTAAPSLVSWEDPAGFSIQYPQGLTFNKHDEDKVNYAHVELTDSAHPGSLIIWVKDLPKGITDTASWGKKAATPSSALSFDTTLGGQPAQKILNSQPTKTATVGLVYDGVLWYVETVLADEAYWQPIHDAIIQSFVFTPNPTSAGSNAAAGVGEEAVDEEEVLE